ILVFFVLVLIGLVVVMYIAPIAQKQFSNLVDNIPKMVAWAQELIAYWQTNQITLPEQVNDAIDHFTDNLQSYIEVGAHYLSGYLAQLISFITSPVLSPFFLLFMLKDGEKLVPFVTQILEKKKPDNLKILLKKIDDTLTAYIQGQVLVSFCVG